MNAQATLTLERDEHVLLVGLNRPAKRNAFNLQMLRELAEAYTAYEQDAELRCLLLHAHGGHFTAGLDLAEVGPAVAAGAALVPGELVDPLEQRERLLVQQKLHEAGDDEAMVSDEDYVECMEYGMPPISGWGMGIDRFVALITDEENIKNTVYFPLMKPL